MSVASLSALDQTVDWLMLSMLVELAASSALCKMNKRVHCLQAQGLEHLVAALAQGSSIPRRFQKLAKELCEVSLLIYRSFCSCSSWVGRCAQALAWSCMLSCYAEKQDCR